MAEIDPTSNQLTFSVSEISQAVKRTVEDGFSYVRVRGEVSGSKRAASGHLYFSLKDDKSVLSGICWKGVASKLSFDVEDGLEVVCVGKLTTYPGRSNYQMVVERMEIAGAGALMALLDKRKKQMAKEGLFDESRKQPLPFMPQVIGVVTSPTGAVIRDILHRIEDRFPVHVIVWPVLVQGEGAKDQIAEAIEGFNNLTEHDDVRKPDLLIVARGGGSLEDLWAFNEEVVVRAAANSKIPLISAVGHETDTTLIDYVSDKRAPTPTGAAEIAVPVREEWLATLKENDARMYAGITRFLDERKNYIQGCARGLTNPQQLLENAMQRLDDWTGRLVDAVPSLLEQKHTQMLMLTGKLVSPVQMLALMNERLVGWAERFKESVPVFFIGKAKDMQLVTKGLQPQPLMMALERQQQQLQTRGNVRADVVLKSIELMAQKLETQSKLLESYHYKKVLERGFALVRDDAGAVLKSTTDVKNGSALRLEFADGEVTAVAGDGQVMQQQNPQKKAKKPADGGLQGSLF